MEEPIDIFRRVYLNSMFFAFAVEICEQSLGVFARLDLGRVGQIVWGLLGVQINEVGQTYVAELVHNTLRIILRYRKLVQVHCLRPINK